nr:uncharacterized protein LOC111861049 isoform X1 [Paramormyrops kingsleyae]XP_023701087.1 uncharacterized protein LOC111861049 isoform X1 [Paramormyrops kingsleyae]XP_023701088.1 uncharacterized protein LOC111861049 isoform X1 [Paramormyrops kingsleyae]XP_023701089.1 uncharacterized protein LOC111861049 isoform X1 [Paramormyrops kingsleyae]
MSYILRHNLTGKALEHLLRLFNEHFPGLVPSTVYLFHKAYGEYGHYEPHFYCSSCSGYIGTSHNSPKHCILCRAEFNVNESLLNGSYFLVLNLTSQIKDVLENPNLSWCKKVKSEGELCDIQYGMEYQKLVCSGDLGENDISLLWNCDGIPVFKSSKCQIWPIQCRIIELDPQQRKNNICVPCLWFGKNKPNMFTLLHPFVSEALALEKDGIKWKDAQNRDQVSRVHVLLCSSDSVARPLLRNTKQFNGTYGCDFCYHKGGGPYPSCTPEPSLRSEEEHYIHAMAATPKEPRFGVKGPSPLMKLSKFQMIKGFVPEYQHSVCLGVTRQLVSLWFDSCNHEKEWYIGTKTDVVDKQLTAIQPPVEVTRTPRSVQDRKFWKASEWRAFLLFYALPVFKDVLPKKFWNNLFLLVFGIYTLLQEKVKIRNLDFAELSLKKLVTEFERLYGTENVTFNVHLLTHIATSVRNWGPLWATSTFSFESFNGTLLKFFNGTTHVPQQIVKQFLRWKSLREHGERCMRDANENVQCLFNELQNANVLVTNSQRINELVRVFGSPFAQENVPVTHRIAVEQLLGFKVNSYCYYNRFIVNGIVCHAESSKLRKRNNSALELKDGMLCSIKSLVLTKPQCMHDYAMCDCNRRCCVLVQELVKKRGHLYRDSQLNISSKFVHEVTRSDNIIAVHPSSFKRKCVVICLKARSFAIPLPNNIKRD